MKKADITTEIARQALMAALEAVEGADLYNGGPWAIDMRLMGEPMSVIYQSANGETYERTFTLEIEGDQVNAVLSQERKKVEARTVWVPVAGAFNFAAVATGWTGRIFRAGEYRERGLSFSVDDLKGMVSKFPAVGVPIKTEHIDTVWDLAFQKSGAKLARIWTENGGTELFGEFQVPDWARTALDDIKKTVSVGLTATFDALREVSLVLNPRVEDALIFNMATAFKASADFKPFAASYPAEAAKIANDANPAPDPAPPVPMTKEQLWAQFSAIPGNEGKKAEFDALFATQAVTQPPSPELADIRKDIEAIGKRQEAQFEKDAKQDDERDALAFFRDELKAGRKTPADELDVLAQFKTARKADRATMQANFAADADGSEEKALKARFAAHPVVFRYEQSISSASPAFTPANAGTGIFSADDFATINPPKETK